MNGKVGERGVHTHTQRTVSRLRREVVCGDNLQLHAEVTVPQHMLHVRDRPRPQLLVVEQEQPVSHMQGPTTIRYPCLLHPGNDQVAPRRGRLSEADPEGGPLWFEQLHEELARILAQALCGKARRGIIMDLHFD